MQNYCSGWSWSAERSHLVHPKAIIILFRGGASITWVFKLFAARLGPDPPQIRVCPITSCWSMCISDMVTCLRVHMPSCHTPIRQRKQGRACCVKHQASHDEEGISKSILRNTVASLSKLLPLLFANPKREAEQWFKFEEATHAKWTENMLLHFLWCQAEDR